jgi:hypothetical protein
MDLALHAPDAPDAPSAAPSVEAPAAAPLPAPDGAKAALAAQARPFARLSPREKAALLRSLPLPAMAPALAAAVNLARGLAPDAAEALLAGAVPSLTLARQLADALTDIATAGRPALPAGDLRKRTDGRLVARLTARTWTERAAHRDRETVVLFTPGTEPEDVIAGQAAFYRQSDPEGGVAEILVAATDASAGLLEALGALFVEGRVVALTLPAALAAAAPLVEQALGPLAARGFATVTVAEPEAPAAAAARGPAPVIVMPCLYAKDEIDFVVTDLASQLAHDGGLDPAAPRVLVLPAGWLQREMFLEALKQALRGAGARWDLLEDLDPAADHAAFTAEGAERGIAVVSLGSTEPAALLAAATTFCNERLGGGLSAQLVLHPIHEDDHGVASAVEQALLDLRYGAVGINLWPAVIRWSAAAPWGTWGGPFGGDARMLPRVAKAVMKGPLRSARRPGYFWDLREAGKVAERMAAFAAAPRARDLWVVAGR